MQFFVLPILLSTIQLILLSVVNYSTYSIVNYSNVSFSRLITSFVEERERESERAESSFVLRFLLRGVSSSSVCYVTLL